MSLDVQNSCMTTKVDLEHGWLIRNSPIAVVFKKIVSHDAYILKPKVYTFLDILRRIPRQKETTRSTKQEEHGNFHLRVLQQEQNLEQQFDREMKQEIAENCCGSSAIQLTS